MVFVREIQDDGYSFYSCPAEDRILSSPDVSLIGIYALLKYVRYSSSQASLNPDLQNVVP